MHVPPPRGIHVGRLPYTVVEGGLWPMDFCSPDETPHTHAVHIIGRFREACYEVQAGWITHSHHCSHRHP